MASSSQLRGWWKDDKCAATAHSERIRFLGQPLDVNHRAVDAFLALNQALVATGYQAVQIGAYNCRFVKTPGKLLRVYSLHSYGIAVDVDAWSLGNPYYRGKFTWSKTKFTPEQINAVKGIKSSNGDRVWKWGGNEFGVYLHDMMHFQMNVHPVAAAWIDWTTVPGNGTNEEDELKRGDKGKDVERLQGMLTDAAKKYQKPAMNPGNPDGDFGANTESAVKAFQNFIGLEETGIANAITLSVLAAQTQ